MIDGITVLSQEAITESSVGLVIACAVGMFAIALIGLAFLCGKADRNDMDFACYIITLVAVGAAIITAVIVHHASAEPTGRYRYECLIDESVSAVELNERYVIKEKRGEIYVIEDTEVQDGNV